MGIYYLSHAVDHPIIFGIIHQILITDIFDVYRNGNNFGIGVGAIQTESTRMLYLGDSDFNVLENGCLIEPVKGIVGVSIRE